MSRLANSLRLLLCLLTSLLSFAGLAGGQVAPGTPSFSAYDTHEIDTINLQNLNIVLNIPVMSKSGAFPLTYGLVGNSYMSLVDDDDYWQPWMMNTQFYGSANGVINSQPAGEFKASYSETSNVTCPGGGQTTRYLAWVLTTADGTVHRLPSNDQTDSAGCFNASFTAQVIDGTGYTVSVTKELTNSVYDRSGALLVGSSITDSNNNSISYSSSTHSYTDTLGLTALTVAFNSGNQTYTWTDLNGSPQVEVSDSTYTVRTIFGCSGITDINSSGQSLPTSVSYPDGTSLGIAYELTGSSYGSDVTGRVGKLTLREGGTVTYTYGTMGCTTQIPASLTRVTSDGTTTYTWASIAGGNTTTVVDNGGNQTVYQFQGGILTQLKRYQGTSKLLTTDVYCYNTNNSSCATTTPALPITEQDVYHTISGMSNSSRVETQYDKYGNVTYSAQYDFGATIPTYATTTTMASHGSGNCSNIGANVDNKPCSIVTVQGANTIALSKFAYDAYGNTITAYVSPNGGSSFLSNATANVYNSNGTPSVVYDLANNPTTYGYSGASYTGCGSGCSQYPFPTSVAKGGLTTYATWYAVGGVKETNVDASGNRTTYGYASCSGGTADPYWRVMSITDPLTNVMCKTYPSGSSPDTASSSFSFNSSNSVWNTTITTDGYGRTVDSQRRQGPSGSYDTVSTAYGWSSNYRTVATSQPCTETSLGGACTTAHTNYFDPLGRLYEEVTTSNETLTNTYSQNDYLAVLTPAPSFENAKQIQNQYDGLGRLTSTCKISSTASGYIACRQNTNTTLNGVLTSTTYTPGSGTQTVSSNRGTQTRSNTVDGLGRVTSSTTPEGGTITNVYDSVTCGGAYNFPGKLVKSTFANGNFECYDYDTLGRLSDIGAGYSGGGTTLCRRFRYDSASNGYTTQPSGSTITNVGGRMVEAETDNCVQPPTSPITDEWFSYDTDGNMTDMWESTPHSGQYYHSVATFNGNGTVATLHLKSPSSYTLTYGLDGEGRWNSLSEGTTTVVPTAGVTFNAASQPTLINIGPNSDNDAYTYDSHTGNMTKWVYTVGTGSSNSETGVPTWNPNGTLNNLAINDAFNSGGTQTCYFNPSSGSGMGYDDLGRLLYDSCGSGGSLWNQQYTYDQYDNLTKTSTGYVSWNPGYSSTTNHYLCSGCTTDTSGNVTNDGTNTYTWDPFNKMSSINMSGTDCSSAGECLIYDALGHMVEIDNGSVYTEIWYTQLGKFAYMDGTTEQYAYWPTPGGSTALYNGGTYYMHKDWLGSSRIVSDVNASTVLSDRAFAPYGEIYDAFGQTSIRQRDFTGDTQDILSGMYDTPNRELQGSQQGRWLSPDPAGAGWNQYAYPTNPNSIVDPSGLAPKHEPPGCSPLIGCTYGADGGETWDPLQEYQLFGSTNLNVVVGSNGGTVAADSTNSTGDCSAGCVTSSAVNSFNGEVVGTVGPGSDFDISDLTFEEKVAYTFGTLLGYVGDAMDALGHPCAAGVSCGIVVPLGNGLSFSNLSLAGYELAGTWGMVGDTFSMNISISSIQGEGLSALTDQIVSMAQDAGASNISVKGSMLRNAQLMDADLMSRVASMNGWTYQQIDSTTFVLTRSIQ